MNREYVRKYRLQIRGGVLTSLVVPKRELRGEDTNLTKKSNYSYITLELPGPYSFRIIGERACMGLPRNQNLALEGIEIVGEEAFRGSEFSTVRIGHGTRRIEAGAFRDSEIWSLSLPSTLEFLGEEAFRGSNFDSVSLSDRLSVLPKGVFRKCYRLEKIRLPCQLRSIGADAFSGCCFEELSFPSTLEEIGERAFAECAALKKMKLPGNLRTIREETFHQCSALTDVELPPALETMEDRAFAGCKQLAQVTLPAGLKRLGADVFQDCESLKTLSIPASVEECGLWQTSAFRPQRITVQGSRIRHYGAAFAPLAGEVELCAPDVAVMDLPESVRTAAARGLLALEAEGTAIPPEKRTSMLTWLKENRMEVWREEPMREALLEAEAWTFSEAQTLAAIAVEEGQIEAAARLQDCAVRLWKRERDQIPPENVFFKG